MTLPDKHRTLKSKAPEAEAAIDVLPNDASSLEDGPTRDVQGSAQVVPGAWDHPASAPAPGSRSLAGAEDEFDISSGQGEERMERAQPLEEDGVREDMATLALHSATYDVGLLESQAPVGSGRARQSGDFVGMDDAEVMLALKAGNMPAFDYLLEKYRRPIVNFMFRMTHNQAIAEELAQEVFLRVYRSRETYRAEARFSTWLYRIATNLGVNHARDTRHERTASTIYLDEPDAETGSTPEVADATANVETTLLRDERMAAIREHVMALPERQRMGVLMHKYDGMDYKQIGEVLKLSESATKSLLFRAYQTLREKLKDLV